MSRPVPPELRSWTRAEELANCLSHGVGLIGSLVVLPVLIGASWEVGGTLGAISAGVFVGAMVLVYLASTLHHALPKGQAKRMVEVIDRAAIYALIAGTYTPFALGVLRGPWGTLLLVSVWALAALGIVLTILGGTERPFEGTKLYLAMGWLIVLVIGPVLERMDPTGIALITAGGVAYTVGVAFYVANRLKFHHLIWHLFVLLGSACHVMAALWYSH